MGKPFYKETSAWIFTILLAIAAIGVFLAARSLSGQSVGTVQHNIGGISTATPAKPVQANGRYISFDYPSNYKLRPTAPDGTILENFSLATSSIPFDNFSISVLPLPSGNLSDSSVYNVRTQDPNRYTLSYMTAGGKDYPVYADTSNGYQKTAFAVNGKLLATVSLSSASGDTEQALDADLKVVLANLVWH